MKTIFTIIRNFVNAPREQAMYEDYLRHEYGIQPYQYHEGLIGSGHSRPEPRTLLV